MINKKKILINVKFFECLFNKSSSKGVFRTFQTFALSYRKVYVQREILREEDLDSVEDN